MRPELYVTAAALAAALTRGGRAGRPARRATCADCVGWPASALRGAAIRWKLALPAYREAEPAASRYSPSGGLGELVSLAVDRAAGIGRASRRPRPAPGARRRSARRPLAVGRPRRAARSRGRSRSPWMRPSLPIEQVNGSPVRRRPATCQPSPRRSAWSTRVDARVRARLRATHMSTARSMPAAVAIARVVGAVAIVVARVGVRGSDSGSRDRGSGRSRLALLAALATAAIVPITSSPPITSPASTRSRRPQRRWFWALTASASNTPAAATEAGAATCGRSAAASGAAAIDAVAASAARLAIAEGHDL